MYDNNNQNTQETVMAAKVAAELFHARQLTRSLSISSKNLRVLAKRIGQNAAGLAILASFYDECARQTISLADEVSHLTSQTASLAVREWRRSLFQQQLEKSCQKMDARRIPEIIQHYRSEAPVKLRENGQHMIRFKRDLHDLLLDMQKNIRSIAVIAVNSKIEAPRTGEHSTILLDMAAKVEEMITRIRQHIDRAMSYLSSHEVLKAS